MYIKESEPGYSYRDRVFMVSGKGTYMDDTLWISNNPGSGLTQPIADYKTALSDHDEFSKHTNSSFFVKKFKELKNTLTPEKSKKIYNGVIMIYKVPVYQNPNTIKSKSVISSWNTGMAAYDIYNVNAHDNTFMHIPQSDIVKPIDYVYLVYVEQKNIFIHIFKTKNEALGWFNSTDSIDEVKNNSKYIKTFEGFIFELGEATAKPYFYKFNSKIDNSNSGDTFKAIFTTDSDLIYNVDISNIHMYAQVDFYTQSNNNYALTNRGELFRVMSTITKIIEEFLSKNQEIRGIRYDPLSKGGDSGTGRDNLYRNFIRKSANNRGKNVKFIQQGATVFAMFV